jgi:hypothetical protein
MKKEEVMAKLLGAVIDVRKVMWRILDALLISILIISCASQQPRYEIYPARSMTDLLSDPCHWWTKRFEKELQMMSHNEWNPSTSLLEKTLSQAAEEYGIQKAEEQYGFFSNSPGSRLVRTVFHDRFKLEDDPNSNRITCRITQMLRYIDHEHPNLLVEAPRLKSPPAVDAYKLPSLVSMDYPVGVAMTRWTTPPTEETKPGETKPGETNIVIIGNPVVTPSGTPVVSTPGGKPSVIKPGGAKEDKKEDKKEKDGKAQAEPSKAKSSLPEDFKSRQRVALSLSTVLNSPSAFDRIEYVSTYLYIESFPFPTNGDVVLEKEFWERFFALNTNRNPLIKQDAKLNKETELNDMRRAIEDMRVRIIDTETTVKFRDLDFGSLTRKTSDKFTADITATATVPPTLTGITPKLGYSTGVDTESQVKLQQQLDQRSTYVDPSSHFLRITQRGMQSVNLAGRFVENLTLWIPTAQDQIPVLVQVEESETKPARYQVKWLSQPLYSRVDALTLSVIVARQATALAKSTKDSFRLDDPKDAAFIVGITQPYRITLWQNEREMCEVMLKEIFGNEEGLPGNQKVFFTTFAKERPTPLRLFGFTSQEQHKFLRTIQKLATCNQYKVVSLTIANGEKIAIGLLDDSTSPAKLCDFKKKN